MITKRDQDILNFVDDFHVASSSQIHRLFFPKVSTRYSRKRLQFLYEKGFIKRMRSTINNDYAYYIKKPSMLPQTHHDLIRAELYVNIKDRFKLLEWNNEMPIGNIRPDAVAYVGHGIPLLIEIHLSNKFDFEKYKKDFIPIFGMEPRIVICTDRIVKAPDRRYRIVGIDMNGVDVILK